jgi:RNA polymerase sigma-70 factor (ECF subfamily)
MSMSPTRLGELTAAARAAWPGVSVPDEVFAAWIAERIPAGEAPEDAAEKLRTSDLYLACACAHGDERALRAIEAGPLVEVAGAVGRMNLGEVRTEDVMQTVRRILFVAPENKPGALPRIAEYRGRGDLRSWIRITAVRAALRLLHKERHELPLEDGAMAALSPTGGDIELEFIKRQYRTGFKRAFTAALRTLPAREQNLLRQHHLDGLSIDQLGALYRVHRATAARWIQRAQATLLARTKRTLMSQMKVGPSECESIIRLVQSQLHLTLRTLWGAPDPASSDRASVPDTLPDQQADTQNR